MDEWTIFRNEQVYFIYNNNDAWHGGVVGARQR